MELYKNMKIVKKTNLKLLRNLIFFILLIIFTFWYLFKDQDLNELVNTIKISNKKYILIGLLCMCAYYLTESINIRSLLMSLGEKKISVFKTLKYTTIGAFFSAITPGASGGQPLEIYYMSKDNIKPTNGALALLIELCGFLLSTISLSIICGIINYDLLKDGIIWFYLLGVVLNSFIIISMLIAMFSNRLTKKIIDIILKFMKLIKIRNYEKKRDKLEEGLSQYIESAKYIKNHKIVFIKGILRAFIQVVFYHSIPYFIYRSFGLNSLSYFRLFSMQSILFTTVAAIPVPGSIGVSETLFMKLFGIAFGKTLLSGAMLLFRFVSFYIFIISFSIVVIINAAKSQNIESEIDIAVKEIDEGYYKKQKLAYTP